MDGYDHASCTLRWDRLKGGSTVQLLRLLREHADTLRQLHVAHLEDGQAMAALLEILPNCVSLTALELLNCLALYGLPESLGHLTTLTKLHLNACENLTAPPSWVEQRTTWISLGLPPCIRALPGWVTQLAALTTLDLSWCHALTGLPESLGQLAALTTLHLSGCDALTGLPESLGQLAALMTLNLGVHIDDDSGCASLTGLPESLGQLAALTMLDLSWCAVLTGLPESLGQLAALTTLDLSWCHAMTGLPESLGQLAALTMLDLSWCVVLTALPESLVALSINHFSVYRCHLAFPPQSVAETGFPAVKRFLQDFARGAAPLQHDRVMLLGDGGAGKTTLAMALRLHADPTGYQASMRACLREKLAGWSPNRMKSWLQELDPRDRCPQDQGGCRWCHQDARPPATFSTLLSLPASEFSSLMTAGCRICDRLRCCVAFLQQTDAPAFDFGHEISARPWLPEALIADLKDPVMLPDLVALTDADFQSLYGLAGLRIRNAKSLAQAALTAQQQQQYQSSPSSFDILRFIPHVMTRGVELLSPLASPPVTIWDFAGQLEFFPAHQFLLSSSNVIYAVVFDASYGYETSVQRLSHWLSFIASSLDQNNKAVFGDEPHQRRGIEVVLVATHTDSPHYKTMLEFRPGFMAGLVDELSAKFSPHLRIHQHVFCPAYDQPHGGQLQDFCALLTDLATNTDRRLRHSFPASYLEVYKRISASRAESLATKRLPLLSKAGLLRMMQEGGLGSDEPDALAALLPTLETYGFLKRLQSPPDHLLADPVTWLTMVLGEFVSPVQAITLTSTQATPAITTAIAADICKTKLELPIDQVSILMSVMCELDVCYELSGGYVFPSLLPPLTPTDMDQIARSFSDPSRVLLGRRFVVSDGGFLPSTLPLLLHRRLHALAYNVVCVRRDHFFMTFFDCSVMVRFNTAAVEIRSSSGRTACSVDIAVSGHVRRQQSVSCALDRVVFELVLECARPDGPCRSLQLAKHAFCRYSSDTDAEYDTCRRERDEVLGDLVWGDNLICSPSVELQEARQQLRKELEGIWTYDKRAACIKTVADAFREKWLLGLKTIFLTAPDDSVLIKLLSADQIGRFFDVEPERRWYNSFSANQDCTLLATDPFWTLETLPPSTPRCLADVPGRFGWIPSSQAPAMQPTAAPQTAPSAPTSVPFSFSPVLHTDDHITVWNEAFSSGQFGNYCLRAREHQVSSRDVLMRCVLGATWNPRDQLLFDVHLNSTWQHVVRLVLPCKPLPSHDCLLIPLDATAFEFSLLETLAAADIELRVALLTDVFRGLGELHGASIVHGRLLGPQCVVVAHVGPRRVARLTDWCVPVNDGFPPPLVPPFPLAPELGPNATTRSSKEGDLYALGRLSFLILSSGQPPSNDPGQFLTAEVSALDTMIPGTQFLIEQLVQADPAMRWPVPTCLEKQFLLRVTDHADTLLSEVMMLTELQQIINGALVLDGRPNLPPGAQADINEAKALRDQIRKLMLPESVPNWKAPGVFPPGFVDLLDENLARVSAGATYDGSSASWLLRSMRNLFHHPEQFPQSALRNMGLVNAAGVIQPAALFRFYCSRFPRLFFDSFQLVHHFRPSPSAWNERALKTGLGPVVLVARAGRAEHEKNFDAMADPPHTLPIPFKNAVGCRVVATLWSRHEVTLALTLPSGPVVAVAATRHHKRNLEVVARFDLAAGPGLYQLRASNGQGIDAVLCLQVIDQVQFAGSFVQGCHIVQAELPGVFRLRIPHQVQLGCEYNVKVSEATLSDQGHYGFYDDPFAPPLRRFTIPAGSQLAGELVLEYNRSGPTLVLHYLCSSTPLELAP